MSDVDPRTVRCPVCRSDVGVPCRGWLGNAMLSHHTRRIMLAREKALVNEAVLPEPGRATTVRCPFCAANVGAPCTGASGTLLPISHTLRVLLAREKLAAEAVKS